MDVLLNFLGQRPYYTLGKCIRLYSCQKNLELAFFPKRKLSCKSPRITTVKCSWTVIHRAKRQWTSKIGISLGSTHLQGPDFFDWVQEVSTHITRARARVGICFSENPPFSEEWYIMKSFEFTNNTIYNINAGIKFSRKNFLLCKQRNLYNQTYKNPITIRLYILLSHGSFR